MSPVIEIPTYGQYAIALPPVNGLATARVFQIDNEDANVSGVISLKYSFCIFNAATLEVLTDVYMGEVETGDNGTYLGTIDYKGSTIVLPTGSWRVGIKAIVTIKTPIDKFEDWDANIVIYNSSTAILSEVTNNTTIFENGLGYKASTSKYAVIINSDNNSDPVFEARNGNYAIKVCSDGIKIMRNGVWSTL